MKEKISVPVWEKMNLTIEEAAAYLRFSTTYLYKLARANEIPHMNFGRHILFRKADLYAWVGSKIQGA